MRALVTGAAGFIGSHLSGALLDYGAEVMGVDCFTDFYARPLKEANLQGLRDRRGFHFIESRLELLDFPSALAGITHVFHLAAQAGVRHSWGRDFRVYTALNVDATQVLLEACVGTSIERIVFASSSSVYGDHVPMPMREDAVVRPVSPYGVTKLAAEHLCLLYHHVHGVPAVALRYFTVYGPRQRPDMAFHRFLGAALAGRAITLYGDGRQTRDFTFVTDAVAATVAAATRGTAGRVYNIGGGARVAITEVLDLVSAYTGQSLNIRREPSQQGDMRDTFADTTLARQDLAFSPQVALAEGIRAEHRWLTAAPTLA